jgi:hypothetical protein
MSDIPTPTIEVTRNVRLPKFATEADTVSMYGLRWKVGEVEFGCSTYTPEPAAQLIQNDHYEMMTIQHLLDEFVRWCNGRDE